MRRGLATRAARAVYLTGKAGAALTTKGNSKRWSPGARVAVGVGDGPSVAVAVGVGDGPSVAVAVGLGVGVAVGVRVGVAVAVAVDVGGAAGWNSNAPTSHSLADGPPRPLALRGSPRWSTPLTGAAVQLLLGARSMAGLPGGRACVSVGPPLSARGRGWRRGVRRGRNRLGQKRNPLRRRLH